MGRKGGGGCVEKEGEVPSLLPACHLSLSVQVCPVPVAVPAKVPNQSHASVKKSICSGRERIRVGGRWWKK